MHEHVQGLPNVVFSSQLFDPFCWVSEFGNFEGAGGAGSAACARLLSVVSRSQLFDL